METSSHLTQKRLRFCTRHSVDMRVCKNRLAGQLVAACHQENAGARVSGLMAEQQVLHIILRNRQHRFKSCARGDLRAVGAAAAGAAGAAAAAAAGAAGAAGAVGAAAAGAAGAAEAVGVVGAKGLFSGSLISKAPD